MGWGADASETYRCPKCGNFFTSGTGICPDCGWDCENNEPGPCYRDPDESDDDDDEDDD